MSIFSPTNIDNKVKPSQILGGILGGFDEIGFETEAPLSAVKKGVGGIFEDILSLGQDIAGIEQQNERQQNNKFPAKGSIEFNNAQAKAEEEHQQIEDASVKRIFFQGLKEDVARVENARDRMIYEEELTEIGAHISTEEKNKMLHYQAGYKDRSIYQMAELRKKLIEQKDKDEKEKRQVSIAQTQTKSKTAMQGIFEGASGTQGSGTANLSTTGGGAG